MSLAQTDSTFVSSGKSQLIHQNYKEAKPKLLRNYKVI
jgi:hypothetical protein